jgi:hypothetical protein
MLPDILEERLPRFKLSEVLPSHSLCFGDCPGTARDFEFELPGNS